VVRKDQEKHEWDGWEGSEQARVGWCERLALLALGGSAQQDRTAAQRRTLLAGRTSPLVRTAALRSLAPLALQPTHALTSFERSSLARPGAHKGAPGACLW